MSRADSDSLVTRATSKAFARILPLLFACYIIAYVDRSNVGFAKLTMQQDLVGFDNEVIGFGAGLFFIGYFLLEIPGTLLVERWSARKWVARIMLTWGVVAAATAFVKTPHQFYWVRFLLGLAEAGFFPGIVVYLTHWFPVKTRARALGVFMMATPVAQLVSPLSYNWLLDLQGVLGLRGWQWVYIAWGIPAVVMGMVVLWLMPDRPRHAKWLSAEEKGALEGELLADMEAHPERARHGSVWAGLKHPKVLVLTLGLFSISASNYAIDTFLPTILRDWYGLTPQRLALVSCIPPVIGLLMLVFVGWSSDRLGERRLHTAGCLALAGVGIAVVPFTQGSLVMTLLGAMMYAGGNKGSQAPFWAMPSLLLTGTAAAGATGMINSVGNLGGFLGPSMMGYLEKRTGSFLPGLLVLAGVLVFSAVLMVCVRIGRGKKVEGFAVVMAGEAT